MQEALIQTFLSSHCGDGGILATGELPTVPHAGVLANLSLNVTAGGSMARHFALTSRPGEVGIPTRPG